MHALRIALYRILPCLEWLPELKHWPILQADLMAGLTVAMLFIPQSMAYAHLANLPVYVGLYAAFIPPIVAALFGSSRFLSTGPVPITSLLTAVALMPMAAGGTSEQLQYLVLLTLMTGLIQLLLSVLRFGVVVNFLSYPVILGFINAVAVIIASMQLSSLLGVSAVTAPHYYQTIWQILKDALVNTHWPSVAMATITFITILGGRRYWPRLPHILIAVIMTSALAWLCGYGKTEIISSTQDGLLTLHAGGEIVGKIPQGLPSFEPVVWDWNAVSQLFMAALVIALVGFTEAITIAKRIATKSRQRLNINQELFSQGLAKCVGSFFQSMPVSGGFTRSAINYNAGAKTGFSSVVAGLVVMLVLLWFTSLFYYLPYATLAAVIIVGVLGLIDLKEMRHIWRINRNEGLVSCLTFLLTLFLAPQLAHAVILGMLLSLGVYLYETMRPRFNELLWNNDGAFKEIDNESTEKTLELVSFVRFGGSLYFANVAYFEEKILQLITSKKQLRYIILDCVGINKLDASGLQTLCDLCKQLNELNIHLWLTQVHKPVLNVLKRGEFIEHVGEKNIYKDNQEALSAVLNIINTPPATS